MKENNYNSRNTSRQQYDTYVVQIRNMQLPKTPRVFDVTVNNNGDILRYEMQNIKGTLSIENLDVQKQIRDFLIQRV